VNNHCAAGVRKQRGARLLVTLVHVCAVADAVNREINCAFGSKSYFLGVGSLAGSTSSFCCHWGKVTWGFGPQSDDWSPFQSLDHKIVCFGLLRI
jgi:hypothetical protein